MVAIGETVGACANELIESATEQIQTITNPFIADGMRSTLYLDSTTLSLPRRSGMANTLNGARGKRCEIDGKPQAA